MSKLVMTSCTLAKVEELFKYKKLNYKFTPFPGYDINQWGIKAHNRPWIIENGDFQKNINIIEVGGAYSTLPLYLAKKYNLKAWVGDDFGEYNNETQIWSRWGNPKELIKKNKPVKYIYQPFGIFSKEYRDEYFDRIFSVSTLEHIPYQLRLDVIKDMNRCLKNKGISLHTIDISTPFKKVLKEIIYEKIPLSQHLSKFKTEINSWIDLFSKSGVEINTEIPNTLELLNRSILVESPDVVYRYYPPNNEPKEYIPNASLLIIIESV